MELARRLSLGQQIDEINPHSLFMKQNKMDGDLKRALEESMKPQENPNVLKAIEASLKPEGSVDEKEHKGKKTSKGIICIETEMEKIDREVDRGGRGSSVISYMKKKAELNCSITVNSIMLT
eukprot:UN02921